MSTTARPTGRPSTRRSSTHPKLVCTSAPRVKVRPPTSSRREAEPMPPFSPKHTVPFPAPTSPSGKSLAAVSTASMRWDRSAGRSWLQHSVPSLVSPTTGLTERQDTPSSSQTAKV